MKRKWKSYWVYDRAVVAPTYLIGAGIRSNVVPLVDDECCKESERLSVENAQYEHDGICKWYPLLYSKPKDKKYHIFGMENSMK